MKLFSLAVLAAVAVLAQPLSAQTSTPPAAATTAAPAAPSSLAGLPIERFDVVGNTSVARDTIRVYLGIEPGAPYNPKTIQKNFGNLWQTGLFDDIRIEADKGENGVIVRVIVKERPRIGAVEYRGNKNLQLTKINEALEREKIDIHVGNTIEQTLLERAAETIRKTYQEGGFEGVTVTSTLEKMGDPNEVKIVFNINEGVKAKIARIEFEGNKRFSDRRLRSTMKEVKKNGLISWIRKRNLYVPSKLDEDIERVRNLYLDYGYKDVEIGDPQVTTLKTKKPRVKVTIPIREGSVHTFGNVTVTGNKIFTEEQLIGKWPLKGGQTLSRKPIQNRIEDFEERYRQRGYIYAYINPEYEEVDNNVVNVHLDVYEGEQFHLGRLEFEGNSVTKDKVLRREIFLAEGDIMDMETFKASMYKLGQLGYFKVTENPDFKVNPETKKVDVTVKGEEQGKNDFQFGGGYSEAYGFFGQMMFSTRNFLGEGETFGISLQRGRRQNYYSLSYMDPWFMDTPNSLGVSVYDRQTITPASVGYESRAKGGSVAYGFRLDRFESFSVSYGLERRHDISTTVTTPDENGNVPLPTIQDERFTTSAVVPAYLYDSRDNPYDTTSGRKFSVTLAYIGGPLGGTINIIKPVVNFSLFHKLSRRTSLNLNIEGGQIFPQGSHLCANTLADLSTHGNVLCVPRSERFYVGGEYSVRGFRSYSISPKEEISGQQISVGGYKYNVLNLEYLYRINDPLRLVFFADAGNSYGFDERWDFTRLRYSAGAELRIFLPVFQFPLRFIYAHNLRPQPKDDFESFMFSIGNTF